MAQVSTIGLRGIGQWLEERAEVFGDRVAVREVGGRSLTYTELLAAARGVAHEVTAAGVAAGERVAIHLRNRLEYVPLMFGIAAADCAVVHSSTLYATPETAHVMRDSDARLAYFHGDGLDVAGFQEACARVGTETVDLSERGLPPPAGSWPRTPPGPEADAGLLYTSGSTGQPKAVVYAGGSYAFAGRVISDAFHLGPEDTSYCVVPLFHMNAQMTQLTPILSAGGCFFVQDGFDLEGFWETVEREHITYSSLPATIIRMLLTLPRRSGEADTPLAKVLLGLSLTAEQQSTFESRFGAVLLEAYGLTEGVSVPTINPLHGLRKNASGGLPTPPYRVRVVTVDGNELPVGEVGEIQVACATPFGLMARYHADPEKTAATMADGWLRTGDHGVLDADGYLHFRGRSKDMIKRAGHNVSAAEVERVLAEHPSVREVAVIGVPDPVRDEAVKAFVVCTTDLTTEDLSAHCRAHLAAVKVPTLWEFMDDLPKTPAGKINKTPLREQAAKEPA